MKRIFLYLSMFTITMAFTACSTEGEDVTITNEPASSASAPALTSDLTEALTLKFNTDDAPFKEIAFTETKRAIITLKKNTRSVLTPMMASKTPTPSKMKKEKTTVL